MGIPFYFASLCRNHKGIVTKIKKDAPAIMYDVFGIDFNCLIHKYIDDNNPITSVVDALENILLNVAKSSRVFIAIDGLVPFAKIVQQRYRRFRRAAVATFDRNQISPGTPYMKELEEALRAKFPYAIISGTGEPGEGEHKIFKYIRNLSTTERKSICIYGLDSDLILICLSNYKLGTIQLLRETDEIAGADAIHISVPFATLNINVLLGQLPIKDVKQYIALCMLCFGNDFMPNIGIFSLREGGYERALEYYDATGNPDLTTFEGRDTFLSYAGERECDVLCQRISLRKRPEEKTILGKVAIATMALVSKRYGYHILDGVENMEPVVEAFWKTFHWSYSYFINNEPPNWDWYYPYPDAPLIYDILQYDEAVAPATSSAKPSFTITDQLQFILPSKSLRIAKRRVINPDETYDEATDTRKPWLKRHVWEAEPRISLPWVGVTYTTVVAQD